MNAFYAAILLDLILKLMCFHRLGVENEPILLQYCNFQFISGPFFCPSVLVRKVGRRLALTELSS